MFVKSVCQDIVDDTIHFVIFYKKKIKQFLKDFKKKYFRFKKFKQSFEINKGFKILTKEGQVLEWLKGQSQPTNKLYALQLNNNALQAKLQSRR